MKALRRKIEDMVTSEVSEAVKNLHTQLRLQIINEIDRRVKKGLNIILGEENENSNH